MENILLKFYKDFLRTVSTSAEDREFNDRKNVPRGSVCLAETECRQPPEGAIELRGRSCGNGLLAGNLERLGQKQGCRCAPHIVVHLQTR